MSDVLVEKNSLENIADAIRDKGVSGTFKPAEMASAISEIPTSGSIEPAKAVSVSTNGTSTISPASGYDGIASVNLTVSVPQPSGTAAVANVLSGKTFASGGSLLTGTMTNRGAVTQTISTQNGTYTIPAGYHNGSGVVTATLPAYDGTVE